MRRHVLVAGLIGALGLAAGPGHVRASDPTSPVEHVSISTMIAKPKKKPSLLQRIGGFFSFGPSKEEEKAKKEAEDKKELMKNVARPIPGETTGNFRARGN